MKLSSVCQTSQRAILHISLLSVFCMYAASISGAEILDQGSGDAPVFKIDSYLPDRNRISWTAGVGYSSTANNTVSTTPIVTPIGHSLYLVQNDVRVDARMRDSLFSYLNMRYGISRKTNMTLRVRASHTRTRAKTNEQESSYSNSGIDAITFGLNHQLTSPYNNPFVIAYVEGSVQERSDGRLVSGKTFSTGITSHWVYDPLVLSLIVNYSYLQQRSYGNETIDPGDLFSTTGLVGFSVNPEVTLKWGVSSAFKQKDRGGGFSHNNEDWSSSFSMFLGTTYRISNQSIIDINYSGGMGSQASNQISVNFSKKY